MFKDRLFDLQDIQRIMMGTGYGTGFSIHDGSPGLRQTSVKLNNDDYLWVYFWMWYNK
jgi:hypothetical protein